MNRIYARLLAAILVTANLTVSAEAALPRNPIAWETIGRISTRNTATPPMGFLILCVKTPSFCRNEGGGEVRYSDALHELLDSVNRGVNRSIRPRNERHDDWAINVSVGDCEDYALTKRAQLIEAGVPAGALRIATARTRRGAGHAVLVVRTDLGDLVLDNLSNRITGWRQTGHRWIAMSGSNPRQWYAIV